MSFFRKLANKGKSPTPPSPTEQSRGLFSHSKDQKRLSRGDASYNSQASVPHPPPYAPVAPPQGAASSYYGNNPMPQYPPGADAQQPHPQPQISQHPPNPLINPGTIPLPSSNPVSGADDPYSFLRTFDTVIVVDDSGSMAGSRWQQCAQALATIVPIVTYYDSDGVDLCFLNAASHPSHQNIRTPGHMMEVFSMVQPRGATPTGQAIKRLLKPYLEKLKKNPNSVKPMNVIVITDGIPTDDLEGTLTFFARKLDDLDADLNQVGIQFFQIGDDAGASEALRELDDALGDNVRDMVDTVPWKGSLQGDHMLKGDYMLKVVLGAVNKRLDRMKID